MALPKDSTMTDYKSGQPQDDPNRIPDRPLPQPAKNVPASTPQNIPEQRLARSTAETEQEVIQPQENVPAPHSVSPYLVESGAANADQSLTPQAPRPTFQPVAPSPVSQPASQFAASISQLSSPPSQFSFSTATPVQGAPTQYQEPAAPIVPYPNAPTQTQSAPFPAPAAPSPPPAAPFPAPYAPLPTAEDRVAESSAVPPQSLSAAATAIPPATNSAKPATGDKPKRNWGDLKLIAKYYLTVVNEVVFSPGKLFAQAAANPDLVEPAVFMVISIGICSLLQIISGDIGGIFRFIGKIFCVLASAFVTTYALRALDSKGDFRTLFKVYAYSQAPMVIGWIKLGSLNIGGLIAVGYSMYLSVVGLEHIYRIQRTQASVIVLVVGLVVWGIAKLLGIL